MKVVLFGATGKAGSRILKELIARGHQVVAAARNPEKVPNQAGVTVKQDDLSDVDKIAELVKGADAAVSAYGPPADNTDALVGVTERQIKAFAKAGGPRLLVVGGAGGLEVAPGVSLLDSGNVPEMFIPIAVSHGKAYKLLKDSNIDWTYFAPAGYFEPGQRTGQFRLGKDNLVMDEKGDTRISMEDYAIAVVDELEKPAHSKQRFSIGY